MGFVCTFIMGSLMNLSGCETTEKYTHKISIWNILSFKWEEDSNTTKAINSRREEIIGLKRVLPTKTSIIFCLACITYI